MKKAYVVVEGQRDVQLLSRILPPYLSEKVEFVVARGRYAVRSRAGAVLIDKQLPVAVVADADTTDEASTWERKDLLRLYLRQAGPDIPFEVFLAVPTLEVVLFEARDFLENIAQRSVSQAEWELGKLSPAKFLKLFFQSPDPTVSVLSEILRRLDEPAIEAMRKHPLVADLIAFLSSVTHDEEPVGVGAEPVGRI